MGLIDFIRGAGRKKLEPAHDTIRYPNLITVGRANKLNALAYKATPFNLRNFSHTPYPRRAINAIKNPIKMLDWEIVPIDGAEWNSELKRQAEIATYCLSHPNQSDDFEALVEQILEDYLIGAGAVETQIGGDKNRPLWMWPVDGLSIQIYPEWDGNPGRPRYAQTMGYGSGFVGGTEISKLRDDELMYVRPNPSTATPFGYGPLEMAFKSIARLMSVGEFAGNVAGNARPSVGLDLGDVSPDDANAFRSYWRNDIEGEGEMPIYSSPKGYDGKGGGSKVVRFYPEGDDALYLKYQELLVREIAAAFDLSPQNFGLERDINRSQGEVSEDRDWDQAIKPTASTISKALTRHCIHRKLGYSQLRFRFTAFDREDEQSTMKIAKMKYEVNATTGNEIRDSLGEPRLDNEYANLTYADVQIAVAAAKSTQQVFDNELPPAQNPPANALSPGSVPASTKPKKSSQPKKGR